MYVYPRIKTGWLYPNGVIENVGLPCGHRYMFYIIVLLIDGKIDAISGVSSVESQKIENITYQELLEN